MSKKLEQYLQRPEPIKHMNVRLPASVFQRADTLRVKKGISWVKLIKALLQRFVDEG